MLILPTDALLWLLVLCATGYGVYVRRHDHLLAPWRRVGRSAIGMSALFVLSVFIAIALLDSLHYRADTDTPRNSGEVRSVLDNALSTLLEHGERTYSAPLATRAYAKETIEDEHGAIRREFPRLNYGGAQLRDEAQHARDIAQRAGAGALIALALGLVLIALFCALRALMLKQSFASIWRTLRTGQTEIAWRSILATMLGVLLFAGVIAGLATNYHVLGTDKVGQDVLYLSLKSIRTGVVIGGLTSLVMLPVALLAFALDPTLPVAAFFLGGYLMLLLLGMFYLSIGCFASVLTKNQIVAGFLTFGTFLVLWVIGWFGDNGGSTLTQSIVKGLSITEHFSDFARGIVDSYHVVYYLSFITFGLFLTAKSVDMERWRG